MAHAEEFGKFLDQVSVKWLDDGRMMELLADFRFQAPDGQIWIAHKGAKVDGASIPKPFWSLIGGPFEGKYRDASVIHDYYCDHHLKTWQATHMIFYVGMRADGVAEPKAKAMYYAVYAFGPRWTTTERNEVLTEFSKGKSIETLMTLQTTTTSNVEVTEQQKNLVESLESRLDKGEALSLADIERMANEDRKSATELPVKTDVKTIRTNRANEIK